MKTVFLLLSLLVLPAGLAQAQDFGYLYIPESSQLRDEDVGFRAHTNHLLVFTEEQAKGSEEGRAARGPWGPWKPEKSKVITTPSGETPQSIRLVYQLPGTGGVGTIAIVDAFDYATALSDFNTFANQYGLPKETSTNPTAATNQVFQVVYASGVKPAANPNWNQEAALDIEWAHAMAPNAKIVLVEAATDSLANLYAAVKAANSVSGVREVSMSWGGGEYLAEASEDSLFTQPGVIYFAAAGDKGGVVDYPSSSPNVISAGGTTINRNTSGAFVSETTWDDAGGGPSRFEGRPAYQNAISLIVGNHRGTPDLSFDGNPSSGVSVYDSTPYDGFSGWLVFGGTSVATPALAGIVNTAQSGQQGSVNELTLIYGNLGQTTDFRDIISGLAGRNRATTGWDFATGVGSCLGLHGK